MIQFTLQQMDKIKQRASSAVIESMITDNAVVLENEVLVPPDGRATWNLYYFCPEHGVRLQWDRHLPKSHCCSVDGKIFTGEPYDGAWWRWLNGLNAKAAYDLGLLWHITGEAKYLYKVKEILLRYALYYPNYEVHGGIPYNGPGKANAQTLCEANCHLDFARGYDFVRDQFSVEEQEFIEKRLLREGADFLIEHRTNQLHNHEMKINATIGVIGLILDDERYIEFSLNSDYGIHYQLNHGSTDEGMWFEGSIHYHYYALQALVTFEKIACNTAYSISSNSKFLKMLKFPLNLVLNTGDFPRLNDCIAGQEKLTHSYLFEFAYAQYPCEAFARALKSIYQNISRDNIDALLYGIDKLPKSIPLKCASIHTPQAGITIHHDPVHNHAFLLKHSPYGGEHDHYDRLGLIIVRGGKEILPDLGTTGYGAELHYGYYKNTATHNTLVVNQKNQPPINPILLNYKCTEQYTLVDTLADWNQRPASVDSHTIEQWDSESYEGIVFRRTILCIGEVVIELNTVENPRYQQLDLTYHVRGKHAPMLDFKTIPNPLNGPLERMDNTRISSLKTTHQLEYEIEHQNSFRQQFVFDHPVKVLIGEAPDNPATNTLAYTLARTQSDRLNCAVLHDLSSDSSYFLKEVVWKASEIYITLLENGLSTQISYNLSTRNITL